MNVRLLGFFSGFPKRLFTDEIAEVLKREITERKRLVFISCNPADYSRNDDDSRGMHGMFEEKDMPFQEFAVIDERVGSDKAKELIGNADCVFLMGGNATQQYALMKRKDIVADIRSSRAAVLGVSAGAMNMGKTTVDIYETDVPYEGLGFADITVKAHYPVDDAGLTGRLEKVSMEIPVTLMKDESAIFINQNGIFRIGEIFQMIRGEIKPITDERLESMLIY